MSKGLLCDEDLIRRLPLPLAQLYRRAHNAKTPLDRHQAAYYLWEASLKLLGSVAIVAYAERGLHQPELADSLQNLARPAVGHWWEFVRKLVPILADHAGDAGFCAIRDLVLGRAAPTCLRRLPWTSPSARLWARQPALRARSAFLPYSTGWCAIVTVRSVTVPLDSAPGTFTPAWVGRY